MKNIKYCNLQFRVNVLGQAILPREKTIMLTDAIINQFKYLNGNTDYDVLYYLKQDI